MLFLMVSERVVDRPFAAVSTRDTFPLMPFARLVMKSGIHVCISARGPVSGTEKCRKFLMALATEEAAFFTLSIAPLMPEAMLPTRSEPQDRAEDTTLDTASFALLNPPVIFSLILLILPVIAESIFWKPVETEVARLETVVETVLLMFVQAVVTPDFILSTVLLTVVLIFVQAVVTLVLIPFMTLVTAELTAFHALVTAVWIPVMTVAMVEDMTFQTVSIVVLMVFITVETAVEIAFQTVLNVV